MYFGVGYLKIEVVSVSNAARYKISRGQLRQAAHFLMADVGCRIKNK